MPDRLLYDEKEVLLRVAEGDGDAFGLLYNQYRDKTFSYIFDLVRSELLAEDIFQSVFAKIWEERGGLMKVANFNAYLYACIKNRALDGLRRVAKEHAIIQEMIRTEEATVPAVDELAQYKELQQKLHLAVRRLPLQQRQVYQLSREEGLKHEEIAARLNIAVTTVNKHITRALHFLKNNLRVFIIFLLH